MKCLALAALLAVAASPALADVETIVLMRHGEKPEAGLGQLSCKGLNRALALPATLARLFPRPDALYAPDPSDRKQDGDKKYDYVRPLATIEPTAIALGMPVEVDYGLGDMKGLLAELDRPKLRNATVLVAWEHHQIEEIAHTLLATHGADPGPLPSWKGEDFDSLWVITITRREGLTTATLGLKAQGLDGQPDACQH